MEFSNSAIEMGRVVKPMAIAGVVLPWSPQWGRTQFQGGERMIHVEPDDPPLTLGTLNLDGHFQAFTPDFAEGIGSRQTLV